MKITRYADIEIRSADEQTRTVAGVAAVFNREQPMGWYTESIDEHAFDETDMSDTILNFNHNDDIVLAGVKNGSLQLEVREDGLHVTEARIVGTTQGNDVLTLVREGLIDKMSFAFTVDEDEWENRTKKVKELISICLKKEPEERITINEFLNHPWIKKNFKEKKFS